MLLNIHLALPFGIARAPGRCPQDSSSLLEWGSHLHTRIAELGVVLHHCHFFFTFFKKHFWEKNWKKTIFSPFLLLTFSILFKKKGENYFFQIIFPKMFFEKLIFFFKSHFENQRFTLVLTNQQECKLYYMKVAETQFIDQNYSNLKGNTFDLQVKMQTYSVQEQLLVVFEVMGYILVTHSSNKHCLDKICRSLRNMPLKIAT